MKIDQLKNKNILLLGYGVEGKSTEKFLKNFVPSSKVEIADRTIHPELFNRQEEFDLVIKSPGIPKVQVKNKNYSTATNIFFANVKAKTIGVTGSKGKSTTSSMLAYILNFLGKKITLVGNIGQPMLNLFFDEVESYEYIVCELSSYQLDDIKYCPDVSVIVSLFPDHMDYHGGLENYYMAKKNILTYADKNNIYVYNPAFDRLASWAEGFKGKSIPYNGNFKINMDKMQLKGEHNRQNIFAVLTVLESLNLQFAADDVIKALQKFKPLEHRLKFVGYYQGIDFYDDAISTTPESTIAAIKSLKNISTILLGGEDRGYDFHSLVETLYQYKIKNIVFFPNSGKNIKNLCEEKFLSQFNFLETDSMEEAVKFAYKHSISGSICLLSTASPSYSVWKNFAEKGNQFKKYVLAYAKK